MHGLIVAANVALMFFAPCVVAMRGDPDSPDGEARRNDSNQRKRGNGRHGEGKYGSAKSSSHA